MERTRELPAIVVGVDGSAPSVLALRWAGALAPLLKAHIRAVTCWQIQIAVGTFTPVVWNPDDEARKVCAAAVDKAFDGAPPDGLEMVAVQGSAPKYWSKKAGLRTWLLWAAAATEDLRGCCWVR